MRNILIAITFVCASLCIAAPVFAQSSCPGEWLAGDSTNGVRGSIYSTLEWDSDGSGPASPQLVCGGLFTVAGDFVVSNMATWTGTEWRDMGGGVNGAVYCLAVLADNRLLVGGAFTRAGEWDVSGLACWDGVQWSRFAPAPDTAALTFNCLLRRGDGRIIAGGFRAGDAIAGLLYEWNGSLWTSLASDIKGSIRTVCVLDNGDLVVGGAFSTIDGVLGPNIARLRNGAWEPIGSGTNAAVNCLLPQTGGGFIAGGSFRSPSPGNLIARWNGTSWQSLRQGLLNAQNQPGSVTSLAVDAAGGIIAAGSMSRAGGTVIRNIARWDGSSWSPLGLVGSPIYERDSTSGVVYSLSRLSSGELVAAGSFKVADDIPCLGVSHLVGGKWTSFGSAKTDRITDICVAKNGDVVACGSFLRSDGTPYNAVARWTPTGWQTLPGTFPFTPSAVLQTSDGRILTAGEFDKVVSGPGYRVLAWNGTSWEPLGTETPYSTHSARVLKELPDGRILVAGWFDSAGGQPAENIAAWDGAKWSQISNGCPSVIDGAAIAPNGDLFIIAGSLIQYKAIAGNPFLTYDNYKNVGWFAWSMEDLAVLTDGRVVVGGTFPNRLAIWDGSTWTNPAAPPNEEVKGLLALPDGGFIVSGYFTSIGGIEANGIARFTGSNWSTLGLGFRGGSGMVFHPDGIVFCRDSWSTAGNVASPNYARWRIREPWITSGPASIRPCGKFEAEFQVAAGPATAEPLRFSWQISTGGAGWQPLLDGDLILPGGGELHVTESTNSMLKLRWTNLARARILLQATVASDCAETLSQPAELVVFAPDLDCDGYVDNSDFSIFLNAYDTLDCADPGMTTECPADFNRDGVVDDADFVSFVAAYNELLSP